MIGTLRGRLTARQAPHIIVECGGVGYEIETPMSTFLDLPGTGEDVFLHTHLLVREDAQILFGFASAEEKRLFRSLLRVSGVGAKMALAILSGMSVDGFARCVQHEDAALLVKIPGIGKKTAERLIIDMRDRVKDMDNGAATASAARADGNNARGEAFDALCALGYKPAEVNRLLGKLETDRLSAEEIIRSALRNAVT
jgi:Holliday junction DNA helicase RuvA